MRSMAQLVASLERQGLKLSLDRGEVRYQGSPAALSSEEFVEARGRKVELIRHLEQTAARAALPPVIPRPEVSGGPLSQSQAQALAVRRRGWRAVRPCVHLRIDGALDPALLREVVNEAAARHATFRTAIVEGPAGDEQTILETSPPTWITENFSGAPEDPQFKVLRQWATEMEGLPTDLAHGQVLAAGLARTSPDTHVLVLTADDAAADLSSMHRLGHEIAALYRTRAIGAVAPLPPEPLRHLDYALWERDLMAADDPGAWWRSRLEDAAVPDLAETGAPDGPSLIGVTALNLGGSTSHALGIIARDAAIAPRMLVLAAINVVLARHMQARRVASGFLVAGRPPGADTVAGRFWRIAPLVTDVDAGSTLVGIAEALAQDHFEITGPRRIASPQVLDSVSAWRVLTSVLPAAAAGAGGSPPGPGVTFQSMNLVTARTYDHQQLHLNLTEGVEETSITAFHAVSRLSPQRVRAFLDAVAAVLGEAADNRAAPLSPRQIAF